MPAIGRQAARIARDHIDRRKIAHLRHGNAARAGKAGKLDIERIPGRHPDNPSPFPGMRGHDRSRFIARQAYQIARFGDHDLRAIGPGIYPHEDFSALRFGC
jgi:hypothetical protein